MTDPIIEDIRTFYAFLSHDFETEIRLIDPHNTKPPKSIHVVKESDFLDEITKANGEWNVYAGINARVPKGTKKEDVIEIKHIFVDVDPIRAPNTVATEEQKKEAWIVTAQIDKWAKDKGFKEPMIIDSGNGYNMYWKIPAQNIEDSNRDKIDSQTQAFCRFLNKTFSNDKVKIDQVGDLSRIMKVPGTLNIKGINDPKNPWRVSKIARKGEDKEDYKLLIFVLSLQGEEKKTQIIIKKDVPTLNLVNLKNKDTKLRKLLDGDTSGYPSRSEAEMALTVKLMQHNVPETQILIIMDSNPIGKWGEEGKNYKDRTIENARDYVSRHTTPHKKISFQEVVDVFNKWMYIEDEDDIYVIAGLFLSHKLKGDPVWLFLIGPSSDGKTEMLRAFANEESILVQSISPKTIISGYNPNDPDRWKYDLAPRLRDKILLIYDFTEILNKRSEERNEIFSQLRSLYDGTINRIMGNGIQITYGSGKDKDPKIYCSLIAASTPVIDIYINEQNVLGTRHIFYRKKTKNQMMVMNKIDECKSEDREQMRLDIQETIRDWFQSIPELSSSLETQESEWLKHLVESLCKLRAGAKHNNFTDELDEQIVPENTSRVFIMMKKLMLGLKNIDTMSSERLDQIVRKIIISSMMEKRVMVLKWLWQDKEHEFSIEEIADSLKLGRRSVKRELLSLVNLGYLHRRKEINGNDRFPTEYFQISGDSEKELIRVFGGEKTLNAF